MPLINFSGIASGIDAEALIDATSEATRRQRVEPLQKQKTEREDQNTALEQLKTLLGELQSEVRSFSSLVGGGVAKLASSTDETNVTATASNTAANGSYTLNVSAVAKNATYSFQSTAGAYSSASAAIASGLGGTDTVVVTVGVPTIDTITVNVDSTTTLQDFVNDFNTQTSDATASVVNVGTTASPDYRIVLTSAQEGIASGSLGVVVGGSILAQAALDNPTDDPAVDANFTVSGIGGPITKSSNTITDLIPGVTFRLVSTGAATITIATDVDATSTSAQEFVDKYNEIVTFLAENNTITREDAAAEISYGPLSGTRIDDGSLASLRSAISGANYSLGTTVRIFADLGITTERDGTLKFDADVFQGALDNETTSVRELLKDFADTVSLTGGTIDSFIRFNGLLDTTTNNNDDAIKNLQDRITRAEEQITRQEEAMRARFARLESLIGGMQQQQSALTSALAGLQGGRN